MKIKEINEDVERHTEFEDKIPEWVSHLEKIVFSLNIEFSLEAIYYLLDLFMIISDNGVFTNIKSFLKTEQVNSELIDQS